MKTYGQFCPVAKAAELFCERWTAGDRSLGHIGRRGYLSRNGAECG